MINKFPTISVALEDERRPLTTETREVLAPEDIRHPDAVRKMDDVLENIRKTRQDIDLQLSNESISGFLDAGAKAIKGIVNNLRGLVSGLSGSVQGFMGEMLKLKTVKGDYGVLLRYSQDNDYFAIKGSTKLYQINRLGIKWKPYTQELYKLALIASDVNEGILAPMITYFAKGINDPSLFASQTHKPKYQRKDIEATQKQLRSIFSGPLNEFITWGQAFDRNSDVPEMLAIYRDVQELLTKFKPDAMKKSVDLLAEYATKVFDELEKENSDYAITKNQISQLSEGLFVAAKYVEFYTVVVQLAYEIDQVIIGSQQKFLRGK